MSNLSYLEKLPKYNLALRSICRELGEGLNRHATLTNLCRHTDKNNRAFVKDVARAFVRAGYLHKHCTDTFARTLQGLHYARQFPGN